MYEEAPDFRPGPSRVNTDTDTRSRRRRFSVGRVLTFNDSPAGLCAAAAPACFPTAYRSTLSDQSAAASDCLLIVYQSTPPGGCYGVPKAGLWAAAAASSAGCLLTEYLPPAAAAAAAASASAL